MSTSKVRPFSSAILAIGIASLLSAANAFGAAVIQESNGDVRAGTTPALSNPVAPNQRVLSGNSVTTGAGSRVTLRFDDGQVVALHENTEFRIAEFIYRPQDPTADRAVFALLRGALRVVTGALGKRNHDAFSLDVRQTMIGIRGTDFMVAIENPTYLSVIQGAIAATNSAGTAAFEAGTFGSIASSSTLATAIPASTLPEAASSAFSRLRALPIAPADSAATDRIKLPETAAPQAQDAATFGQETADRAHQLKGDLDRKLGREASESARERARDRVPSNRKRQ